MKIMLTIGTLFGGGAERVVSVWANQLSECGYDVYILLYGRTNDEYQINDKIKLCTVADTYEDFQKLSYFERFSRMRNIVKKINPDKVLNFLPKMQIWMMFATVGIKLFRIETVRISPWVIQKRSKALTFLWKKCFSRANRVIVQTAEQAEFFNARVQKKCVVIPNPIAEQYRQNIKSRYPQELTKFISAGRITEQKNYAMMFNAFTKVARVKKNIQLLVFGVGDLEDKLKTLIMELGMENNIFLMGRCNDMPSELLKSDVFLMSSNYEGMPNALAEAMATGLICISTDCKTGPKDLIDDGINGFLVPTGNTEKMAEAIFRVTEMSVQESEKMGRKAREKILNFCSEDNSLNRLVKLIEEKI